MRPSRHGVPDPRPGTALLLTKELLDVSDIGKVCPRWDCPCIVTTRPSPNAYTLVLQRKIRCSPTVNVDQLKPFVTRASLRKSPVPWPVSETGQEGEHEVELLLKSQLESWRTARKRWHNYAIIRGRCTASQHSLQHRPRGRRHRRLPTRRRWRP